MRVAVTGATGVIGSAAVGALVATGHNVVGLARTPDKAAALDDLGAESWRTDLFDRDGLVEMFTGCDAVCNLATHVPVGYGASWPRSWREHDKLRTEGVLRVLEAAREAGEGASYRRVSPSSMPTTATTGSPSAAPSVSTGPPSPQRWQSRTSRTTSATRARGWCSVWAPSSGTTRSLAGT